MEFDTNLSGDMIEKYGEHSQLDVVVEELSELIKETIKYKRTSSHGEPHNIEKMLDELADVIVMEGTVMYILEKHGFTKEDVKNRVYEKQARTRKRYL